MSHLVTDRIKPSIFTIRQDFIEAHAEPSGACSDHDSLNAEPSEQGIGKNNADWYLDDRGDQSDAQVADASEIPLKRVGKAG